MTIHINPFDTKNPMSFTDAAKISTLTALVVWILTFLASASMGTIRADVATWVFDAIKAFLISWASTFLTLAGLDQYIKSQTPAPAGAQT